ncbi:hypothetical protein [Okeania sp. KiyG1]|uniref:hypothetical protein n=1 Tax=Okeania sp. KiyG1 TaxID=2720165 RepID=UPI0019215A55|nr:hypothetical protein [Okeania sp. KiyG1]
MSCLNNQDAQNQPETLQRTEIFNLSQFDSDSAGLLTNVGFSNRTRSESQSGSRADNTGADGGKISDDNDIGRGGDFKKLANQLELLTQMFYKYVDAHRGILEKGLEENQQFTEKFEQELSLLKSQISGSISASE